MCFGFIWRRICEQTYFKNCVFRGQCISKALGVDGTLANISPESRRKPPKAFEQGNFKAKGKDKLVKIKSWDQGNVLVHYDNNSGEKQ